MFAADLRKTLGTKDRTVDELFFISIDATGVDIRVRTGSEFSVERIGFEHKVRPGVWGSGGQSVHVRYVGPAPRSMPCMYAPPACGC